MGMRKELKEPFNNGKAYELIMKIRQYSLKEAGKILQIFVDEGGKLSRSFWLLALDAQIIDVIKRLNFGMR